MRIRLDEAPTYQRIGATKSASELASYETRRFEMTSRIERPSPRSRISVIRRIINEAQERDAEDEQRLYPPSPMRSAVAPMTSDQRRPSPRFDPPASMIAVR
jgi:hypothetical protein